MGIWLTALKAIPWADVIAAAPTVTRGARKLFAKKRAEEDNPPPPEGAAEGEPALQAVQAMQATVAQLLARQQAQDEVLAALSTQNARIVETLDILRMRLRLLLGLSLALGLGLLGLLAWLAWAR